MVRTQIGDINIPSPMPCYAVKNDIVRVHHSVHTFENDTDEITEFVVFRFVPDGTDKREMIKTDKKVVKHAH